MAKKKNNATLGCLIVCVLVIAVGAQLVRQNPLIGVPALVAVLLIIGLIFYAMRPKRCDICGNRIQRKSHVWTIEGTNKTVCVPCNQTLARRRSSAALRQLK